MLCLLPNLDPSLFLAKQAVPLETLSTLGSYPEIDGFPKPYELGKARPRGGFFHVC